MKALNRKLWRDLFVEKVTAEELRPPCV